MANGNVVETLSNEYFTIEVLSWTLSNNFLKILNTSTKHDPVKSFKIDILTRLIYYKKKSFTKQFFFTNLMHSIYGGIFRNSGIKNIHQKIIVYDIQ
uniref:Uncharacterized protein n=1 Tax=Strongyloides venezuelensis TaxID=75913 RepID=A0A0K0FL33_STRVS